MLKTVKVINALVMLFLPAAAALSQTLKLPPRPANALSGSEFAKSVTPLELREREQKIYEQVALGNVPDFLRKLSPVRVVDVAGDKTNSATYYVTPDYLAVGSDEDYFFVPLSPIMAQKVAELLHCSLPTRKISDDIYKAAAVKLEPSPIPPSPAMATVPIFIQHSDTVREQRKKLLAAHPLGALVAGDKKDVVISAKLATAPGKVAIYGWHKPDGKPIQPLYTGHADFYADYSHGIRLVQLTFGVNGVVETIPEVLSDSNLCGLLSDEGVISIARYPQTFRKGPPGNWGGPIVSINSSTPATATLAPATNVSATSPPADTAVTNTVSSKDWDRTPVIAARNATNAPPPIKTITLDDFQSGSFGERVVSYAIDPEAKVQINVPETFTTNKKLKLIFYALPNGNTIDQTVGRRLEASGDNWHFNIQHIGAQTRFLRDVFSNDCSVVVVYLESGKKSWPTWRKEHADLPKFIPAIVDSIRPMFKDFDVRITLSGHSGGGSFIFGYLNGVEKIPDDVERIAFLDSNYAYDPAQGHLEKLMQWLGASDRHSLSVLAYNDAVVVLNGKPIVSAAGGTWGRSHAMLKDMGDLNFTEDTNASPQVFTALNGRVKFLLKENPEGKIYHTVQVEKNGFIQSILSGTLYEGKGYEYFGDAAYTKWIQDR
jgi:hypothetical protein